MKSVKKLLGVFVLIIVAILCTPNSVNANEISDEFKSYLNENGEFVVNAAKGTTEEDLAMYLDFKYTHAGLPYNISWSNISDDLSSFDFAIYVDGVEEKHTVKIKYNYDKEINKTINDYLDSALNGKTKFNVSDLELVSYWLNNSKDNNNNLALYSGELKKLLDYKNIGLVTDSRSGGSIPFTSGNMGFGSFQNNGISYRVETNLGAYAEHIIYVDESVGDTEEDIVEAVQKRIDDAFGEEKVMISFADKGLYDYFINDYDMSISYHQMMIDNYQRYKNEYETHCENNPNANEGMCSQLKTFRDNALKDVTDNNCESEIERKNYQKQAFIEEWNDPNGSYAFLKNAFNDWYFLAEIDFGDRFFMTEFIVVKDSSKMVEPVLRTKDYSTNIEISTNETLPLDTIIQANKITSGVEYERILEILNLTDNVTFDLKLYSDSINNYITKLDDGTFEVKIPIPSDFKGKDLVVYYVKDNGEKETYTVDTTSKPGYAIFTTTHFSIYTLGYTENTPEKVKVTFDANDGKFDNKDTYVVEDITKFDYTKFDKPTREGYKFIGFFTEKNNGKSFEEMMNSEAGIEEDITFYARWEKIEIEENPKTFDGIGNSIAIATITLICLVGTTIYLNKKNKIRA